MGNQSKFHLVKENSFLILCVCFFALFVIIAAVSGAWPGKDISAQFFSAMAGALVAAIITLFLLKGQTAVEADRQKDSKVFEEKLRIYKGFLKKLCDVVKDMEITEDEEIELQFQVSYIAMHTKSDSIKKISEQVREIIKQIRTNKSDKKVILKELFEISDTFKKELYDFQKSDDNTITPDDSRKETIANFSYIVEKDILKFEMLKDRTKKLEQIINDKDAIHNIYNGTVLSFEYFTSYKNGKFVNSENNIVVDLRADEKEENYKIIVYTHQKDRNETEALVKGIWNEENFNPWAKDNSLHVHDCIPFNRSDDDIKNAFVKVLQEVKAYRDHHYSQK